MAAIWLWENGSPDWVLESWLAPGFLFGFCIYFWATWIPCPCLHMCIAAWILGGKLTAVDLAQRAVYWSSAPEVLGNQLSAAEQWNAVVGSSPGLSRRQMPSSRKGCERSTFEHGRNCRHGKTPATPKHSFLILLRTITLLFSYSWFFPPWCICFTFPLLSWRGSMYVKNLRWCLHPWNSVW